jgi:5-deoxy-glucuronate isomerase
VAQALALQSRDAGGPDAPIVSIDPGDAGWEYISFRVWRLAPGDVVHDSTDGEEIGLVLLSGTITVETGEGRWERVEGRASVFEGKPYVLYLPPGFEYRLTAESACEVARAGARAERGATARLITPDDIAEETRGAGNTQRLVRPLLPASRPAERLILSETIVPGGNWSSYPPHKHDTGDPPHETYLEETYYHRFRPMQGFGFQRVYSADGSLDEAMTVQDGTLVLVPRGYHPTVTAPGYDQYYLNVMAGPVREWRFTEDPAHAWVASRGR